MRQFHEVVGQDQPTLPEASAAVLLIQASSLPYPVDRSGKKNDARQWRQAGAIWFVDMRLALALSRGLMGAVPRLLYGARLVV